MGCQWKKFVCAIETQKFLGNTRSDDLVKAFNDGLNELDLTKLIKISINSINSNLKFLSEIKKLRIDKDELVSLIDTGSCKLHVIHTAFNTQFGKF